MKYITPKEYREGKEKDVEIGEYLFRIRKVPPSIMQEYMQLGGDNPEEITADENLTKQVIELILPACVVTPKIVAGKGTEEALGTDELEGFDTTLLLLKILRFSGLTAEAVKELQSFRQEQVW